MSRHTAGPWRIAEGLENQTKGKLRREFIWSDAETKEEREDESPYCIAAVFRRTDEETRMANARLIAAAPELLDALARATEFLDDNYATSDMPDILPACRAALKKAVGPV